MCDAGYSALAGSNRCVRTCAVGPDPNNPLYYEDGSVCWPYCLSEGQAFGVDNGPACIKRVSDRILNGNVLNTYNGQVFAPQCPPNYTGFPAKTVSANFANVEQIYEFGWEPSRDTGGGIDSYICYENCPSPLVNDLQGKCQLPCSEFLAGSNDLCCKTSQCPTNEGEEYAASPIAYPTVETFYTPAATSAPRTLTGYVGNYGDPVVATSVVAQPLACGTCIRDPHSFYSPLRTPTGSSYPNPDLAVKPTKIIRDFAYPTCGPNVVSTGTELQLGSGLQQYSFYSDTGTLIVGSDPLKAANNVSNVDPSYSIDPYISSTPHGVNNGFFPTPDQFIGRNTNGSYYNFQNFFTCQNTCDNAGEVREDAYCMQSPGSLLTTDGGLVYKDYSIQQWAVTFSVDANVLMAPENDDPNRRVMAGLSQTSPPSFGVGNNTSVNLPWTGGNRPANTAAFNGGCTGTKVPARRWKSTSFEQIYELNSSNTPGGTSPGSIVCIEPSVCPNIGSKNPFGFLEIPNSGDGGQSGNMQVFCGLYGTQGYVDVCTSRNMTNDPLYTNMCLRTARFQDPHTQYPSQCPVISDMYYRTASPTGVATRQTTLYGQSTKIPEKNNPLLPGYIGEAVPQAFRVSRNEGLFQVGKMYKYNDVVASFKQNVLGSKSNEVVYHGPFYRCIRDITLSDPSVAPPKTIPQTNVNTQLQYSTADPNNPVFNAYWTDQNIPSEWIPVKLRLAGDGNNLNSACIDQFGNRPKFCPPVCITQCPLGNLDDSDPNYQKGLYEPYYKSSIVLDEVVINESSCYPICGSSEFFEGNGPVCLLRAPARKKLDAYSTCPNGTGPVVQLNDGNVVATAVDAGGPQHSSTIPPYLTVTSGKCYDTCPVRTEITPFDENDKGQNSKNFRQCWDVCPASESFYDGGSLCFKIAAQRVQAETTESTFLQENLQTSSNLTKFAYYGGMSTLWSVVAIVCAVGIFTAFILLVKRQHWVKSTTYFSNNSLK